MSPASGTGSQLRTVESVLELVGQTPLLRLRRFRPEDAAEIYAKLEFLNPGGSVKDRAAPGHDRRGRGRGPARPGATIIEPTAGNTGVGPGADRHQPRLSRDRRGAREVRGAQDRGDGRAGRRGRPDAHREGHAGRHRARPRELAAAIPGRLRAPAVRKPRQPRRSTTAPPRAEIHEQLGRLPDAVVLGAGTGGTFTGVARYFKERDPERARRCWWSRRARSGAAARPARTRSRASATPSGPGRSTARWSTRSRPSSDADSFAAVQGAGAQRGPAGRRLLRRGGPRRPRGGRARWARAASSSRCSPTASSATWARASSRISERATGARGPAARRAGADAPTGGLCEAIMGFATDCIHAGQEPDPTTGADDHARSTRPPPTSSRASASTRATSTRAPRTPRGARSRRTSPRSRAAATPTASPRAWPPPTPCSPWSRPGSAWWSPTTSTAAPTGSSPRSWPSYGVEFAFLDASDAARLRRARPATSQLLWIETPDQPADEGLRHRGPGRGGAPARARSWSSTTPS